MSNTKEILKSLMDLNDSETVAKEEVIVRKAFRPVNDENDEVIVRKVVKEPTDDELVVGQPAMVDGEVLEDGVYDLEDIELHVEDGVVSQILVEEEEDINDAKKPLAKKVVKGGKVVKLTTAQLKAKSKPKGGLSPAQYKARIANLKKARLKAHTPGAWKKRRKSLALRKKAGLDGQAVEGERINDGIDDIRKMNLDELGNDLCEMVQDYFIEKFDVSEDQLDELAEILSNDHFDLRIEDSELVMQVPIWKISDEELNLDQYETKEIRFELEDEKLSYDDIISGIVDEFGLLSRIVKM